MDTGTWNIRTTRGATHDRTMTMTINGNAVNLSGYTAAIDIREAKSRSADLILTLTTENGRLLLGGAGGTIRRLLTPTNTLIIPVGDWWYDLKLVAGGGTPVDYLVRGRWGSSDSVTD